MKTILVTGGSNGIGKAIIDVAKKKGYQTFNFDIVNGDDITKPISLKIKPDILINCAGITRRGSIRDESILNQVKEVLDTNLYGALNITKYLLKSPKLKSIVNIGSKSAFRPMRDRLAYAISKGALVSFTKQLALELAPTVRVNCISPGVIDTKMPESDTSDSKIVKNLVGRKGTTKEVAEFVLAVAENEYITGQDFIIDGGFTLI